MRRKKHGAERISACAHLLIESPEKLISNPSAPFGAVRPLHLEIGCGKGAFACGTAAANPDINLIAMERVADVACLALEKAEAEKSLRPNDNLRFIIGNAQLLGEWFPESCLECIYLNFSDPWPKKGYAKRRLTHADFLKIYKKLLAPGGRIIMKTDNQILFDFSLEQFAAEGMQVVWQTRDLHHSERAATNILTEYEANFIEKGIPICSAIVAFR
jgi:tRNA (guanine-N7-)-methyltransferase